MLLMLTLLTLPPETQTVVRCPAVKTVKPDKDMYEYSAALLQQPL